jgi:SAM-dependent methyltransferase
MTPVVIGVDHWRDQMLLASNNDGESCGSRRLTLGMAGSAHEFAKLPMEGRHVSWHDYADHPNASAAKHYRHTTLAGAATVFKGTRIGIVCRIARDKKVLDVGCVSHNFQFASGGKGRWLHDHVVKAAAECVGVDYDEVGIKQMRDAGYDVVHADITGDLTRIVERGPFDVVVAGEIIEHLGAPQALLSMANEVLRPGGKLVLTTPNPYSPRRQRAGAVGITWENVDHVMYSFPSGIAEMADRSGLILKKYGSVGWPPPQPMWKQLPESFSHLARALRRRAKGERSTLSRERLALPLPVFWLSPVDIVLLRLRGRRGMLRETSIYVLVKPEQTSG